jgi:GxxExxY protein
VERVNQITEGIIGAAIEVHRALGPGLLESAYSECLAREVSLRSLPSQREFSIPGSHKGVKLDCGYRLDFVVADQAIVEIKAVEKVHEAQLLTYLKLTHLKVGLLLNFNAPCMHEGILRRVL